jgi:hypothetical protein
MERTGSGAMLTKPMFEHRHLLLHQAAAGGFLNDKQALRHESVRNNCSPNLFLLSSIIL